MTDTPGGNQFPPEGPKHIAEASEQAEELQHLGHSGESLETLAHSIDEMKESANKNAHEAEENKRKFLKSLKIDAYAIPIITVVGVALSIGASTYWNTKHQETAHLYSQASEIKEDINNLFATRNNLMDAMVQIRAVRHVGQLYCKDGKYVGKDPLAYQEKLYSAETKFFNASYNTTGIFIGDLANKISEFDSLVDIDKGICETNAAKDDDLRLLQRNINRMILEQVNQLREKRAEILRKANM